MSVHSHNPYHLTRESAQADVPYFGTRVGRLRAAARNQADGEAPKVRAALRSALWSWQPEHIGPFLVQAEVAAGLRPAEDEERRTDPMVWRLPPPD